MNDVVAAPIIGFRAWKVFEGGLMSLCAGYVPTPPWPPGTRAVATDVSGARFDRGPKRPRPDDKIGLHAYRNLQDAIDEARGVVSPDGWPVVAGAVMMWGVVQIHESGYRAQYARPVALLDAGLPGGTPEVDERYELPFLPPDELVEYARGSGGEIEASAGDPGLSPRAR